MVVYVPRTYRMVDMRNFVKSGWGRSRFSWFFNSLGVGSGQIYAGIMECRVNGGSFFFLYDVRIWFLTNLHSEMFTTQIRSDLKHNVKQLIAQ